MLLLLAVKIEGVVGVIIREGSSSTTCESIIALIKLHTYRKVNLSTLIVVAVVVVVVYVSVDHKMTSLVQLNLQIARSGLVIRSLRYSSWKCS